MRGCAYFLHVKIFNSFVWGARLLFICLLCKMFVYYPSRVCGGVEGGCLSVYCPHNFVSSSTRPARPGQAHDSKEMQAKKRQKGRKNILNKAIKYGDITFDHLTIWVHLWVEIEAKIQNTMFRRAKRMNTDWQKISILVKFSIIMERMWVRRRRQKTDSKAMGLWNE